MEKSGRFAAQLRVPQDGLFAGEETDVEFHFADCQDAGLCPCADAGHGFDACEHPVPTAE